MKISLVSFASAKWQPAADRFLKQAKNTNIFSDIKIFNEHELNSHTSFFKENTAFLESHPSGFGGWIWKPYIINWAFDNYKDSEYIMYLDIGSEFNINENTIKRFYHYIDIAKNDGIFAFVNRDLEQNLTHCSVIDNIYPEAKNSRQFEANTLILKNDNFSKTIILDWLTICREKDYFNINPNDRYQCCNYWGGTHLHDQSVLSCILKKNKINGISDEGSWYLPAYSISESIIENKSKYPIFTARNPYSYSVINNCLGYKEFYICYHSNSNTVCPERIQVR